MSYQAEYDRLANLIAEWKVRLDRDARYLGNGNGHSRCGCLLDGKVFKLPHGVENIDQTLSEAYQWQSWAHGLTMKRLKVGRLATTLMVEAALVGHWKDMAYIYARACGRVTPNTKLWLIDVDNVEEAERRALAQARVDAIKRTRRAPARAQPRSESSDRRALGHVRALGLVGTRVRPAPLGPTRRGTVKRTLPHWAYAFALPPEQS